MAKSIYQRSLKAMCDGPFVEDWEFQTLMGVSRTELRTLYENWEEPPSNEVLSVVRAVLCNLLYYPHGKIIEVEQMMGMTTQKLTIALQDVPGRDLR